MDIVATSATISLYANPKIFTVDLAIDHILLNIAHFSYKCLIITNANSSASQCDHFLYWDTSVGLLLSPTSNNTAGFVWRIPKRPR